MRHILFSPETFNLAEVTRSIEVAKHLSADFECVFSGYSRQFSRVITEAGFPFRLLAPELTPAQVRQMLAVDQGRGLRHPFSTAMLATRVAGERALIRELAAEAVVIGTTLSQLISARAEHVPLIYLKPFAYSAPHLNSLRSLGMFSRASTPLRLLDDGLAGAVRTLAPRLRGRPRSFTEVAEVNDVRLPTHTVDLLEADLNLITTVPELLPPQAQLPPHYRAVGPVFARLPGDLPPAVRELDDHPQPVVYVAMGSSGNRELLLKVLDGVARAPVQVLAPVQAMLRPDDGARLPDNVHLTSWLPADRLGSVVELAVTHGGEGTVQTSAVQGWPFLGIPLQLEQRYNVQRCVDFGNARLMSPRRLDPDQLAGQVASALADSSLTDAAARMAALLAPVDGAANAADRIREYLADRAT